MSENAKSNSGKVNFIKKLLGSYYQYEALEDCTILTSPGDHPTFGLESLQDMRLFVRKGERFQLTREYVEKNGFSDITKNAKSVSKTTIHKRKMDIKKGLEEDYVKNVIEPIRGVQDRPGHLPRSYYETILKATERIGIALDEGVTPKKAEASVHDLDLTGYMMGWAVNIVCTYNPHADKFKKYWNKKFGQPDAKGTVNPAILVLTPKGGGC